MSMKGRPDLFISYKDETSILKNNSQKIFAFFATKVEFFGIRINSIYGSFKSSSSSSAIRRLKIEL